MGDLFMSILTALRRGGNLVLKHKRIVGLIYMLTFGLALFLGLALQSILTHSIGNSLEINKLLAAYDHTVISEFINIYGEQLWILVGQIKWLLVPYFLLNVFITGGLMHTFVEQKTNLNSLIEGGRCYFWRFFRLLCYILLIHILVALFLYLPFSIQLIQGLDHIHDEIAFFRLAFIGLLIHIPLVICTFTLSDFAKVYIVKQQKLSVLRALWKAFGLLRSNFFQTFGLLLLNGLLIAVIFGIYLLVENWVSMVSAMNIIFMFLIQQILTIVRIAAKLLRLGSVCVMHRHITFTEGAA